MFDCLAETGLNGASEATIHTMAHEMDRQRQMSITPGGTWRRTYVVSPPVEVSVVVAAVSVLPLSSPQAERSRPQAVTVEKSLRTMM